MKIHHVMWDFDGTLFDSYPVMARAFRKVLERFLPGSLPSEGEIMAQMQISMGNAVNVLVRDNGISIEEFNAEYIPLRYAMEREGCEPFAGVVRICEGILASGGMNYIYTHRSRSAMKLIERRKLTHLFADAVTEEDGFARKPAPDAILHLLQKHGMAKSDAIMIGDREIDILAGRNAGIHSCLFYATPGVKSAADYVIGGFGELDGILGLREVDW